MGKDAAGATSVGSQVVSDGFKPLRWWEKVAGIEYSVDLPANRIASRALLSATILSCTTAMGVILFVGYASGVRSVRRRIVYSPTHIMTNRYRSENLPMRCQRELHQCGNMYWTWLVLR